MKDIKLFLLLFILILFLSCASKSDGTSTFETDIGNLEETDESGTEKDVFEISLKDVDAIEELIEDEMVEIEPTDKYEGEDVTLQKLPILNVYPPNIVCLNASISKPEVQEIVISNLGDAILIIHNIELEIKQGTPNDFQLLNLPKKDTQIEPGNSIKFNVRCQPTDDEPDIGSILIYSNDPLSPQGKEIPIETQFKEGNLVLSYEDQFLGYIDFTKIFNGCCSKYINAYNSGKGPVKISKPYIVPEDAKSAYTVQWFKGGGTQSLSCAQWEGSEISGETFSLGEKKSMDFIITYCAPTGKGINGAINIKYWTPFEGLFSLQMYGGEPKGGIDVAPANHILYFFANKGAEAKEKSAVIYNTGNGDLVIKDVKIEKQWLADPDTYSLKEEFGGPKTISANGLLVVTVVMITNNADLEPNGYLKITYVDPLTEMDTEFPVTISGTKNIEGITLPTADAGKSEDYAEAKVNMPITLDGSKSVGGTDPIYQNGYIWFLSAKSAGSKVVVNEIAGSKIKFTPDIAGMYEIRLIVHTSGLPAYFSDEALVQIQVSQ
jgi:hypothetical protein